MTPRAEPRSGGRLGPFRHRSFAVYWTGGLVSNLGTSLQAITASIVVYQLTNSALSVGLLNFLGLLPLLVFAIPGGVISDRTDRGRIIVATHVICVVLATALAALTFVGLVSMALLIVVSFAINTTYAIAKPSLNAILPSLVPQDEVSDAAGLNTLQFTLGAILGPALASIVIVTLGAGWAFTLNALTYVAPIVAIVYLRRRGVSMRPRPGPRIDGRTTPRLSSLIGGHRWVIGLVIGVLVCNAPLEIIRTVSPSLVDRSLGQPEAAAGLLVAAQSVGALIGLLIFVPLRRRGLSIRMSAVGLLVQAAGLAGLAFASTLAVAAILVALVGFGFSLTFPVLTGTLQAEVDDNVRGRVMSLHQMAALGNRPVTAVIFGGIAALAGERSALLLAVLLAPAGLFAARYAWRELAASRSRTTPAEAVAESEAIDSGAIA